MTIGIAVPTQPSRDSRPGASHRPRHARRLPDVGLRAARLLPRAGRRMLLALGLCCAASAPAMATMDIANNGAVLDAGKFTMRVTNVGVMGNAFFNKGL